MNNISQIIIGTGMALISQVPYAYSNSYKTDTHYYKTNNIEETSSLSEVLNPFDYEHIFNEKIKNFYESFIESQKTLPQEVVNIINENMSDLYERFEI